MPKPPLSTEAWIEKAKLRWEGIKEFDYSKVDYKHSSKRVLVGCPDCDDFIPMIPNEHLRKRNGNSGCPECGKKRFEKQKQKFTTEYVVEQFVVVHGDKYDYSEVDYKGDDKPIKVICHKEGHGPWYPTPTDHKQGKGCISCYRDSQIIDLNDFAIGYLKVIRQATHQEIKDKNLYGDQAYWWVKCVCGSEPYMMTRNEFTKKDKDIFNASCKSCTDRRRSARMLERSFQKIKGNRYGFLTVLRDWGTDINGNRFMMSLCKCGNSSITRLASLLSGRTTSCGCKPSGEDSYTHYLNDPNYADGDTVLYFVEIRKKYQKIGIAYDIKRRFGSYCSDIYYERVLPRAKARAIEYISLQWTENNIPKLSKKWKQWQGNTELRICLDIQETINMIDQLAEEAEDMTWEEFWVKYGLATGAEPEYVSIPKDIP